MKQFVLKTPTVLLILLVLSPLLISDLMLGGVFYALQSEKVEFVVRIIQNISVALWYFSILDFFSAEKGDTKNNLFIQVLMIIAFATSLGLIFKNGNLSYIVTILVGILLSFLLVKKIKAVFYERSTWFIVLELILVPVGVYTLTEEIKNWELEKLSEENQ